MNKPILALLVIAAVGTPVSLGIHLQNDNTSGPAFFAILLLAFFGGRLYEHAIRFSGEQKAKEGA